MEHNEPERQNAARQLLSLQMAKLRSEKEKGDPTGIAIAGIAVLATLGTLIALGVVTMH